MTQAPRNRSSERGAPSGDSPRSGPSVDTDPAEAAIVEHYPRLVRLAYLVLPPGLGTGGC
ncbi:hypothetical protein NKH77_15035 [Streptomyces sp. M19]